MSAVDRVADALVRRAARRWPADVRDELGREWTAELHALRTETTRTPRSRAYGQLRFAASLATSRAAEPAGGRPPLRESVLAGAPRLLGFVAVPTVMGLATITALGVARIVERQLSPPGTWLTARDAAVNLAVLAGCVVGLVLLGMRAGRRSPWSGSFPLLAGTLGVGIAIALYADDALRTAGTNQVVGQRRELLIAGLAAVPWMMCVALLVRLLRRLRGWAAVAVAVLGGMATAQLAVGSAVLALLVRYGAPVWLSAVWLPTTLALGSDPNNGTTWAGGNLIDNGELHGLPVLVTATTAFAVAFALAATRAVVPAPSTDAEATESAPAALRPPRLVGAICAAGGVTAWLVLVAYLTPLQQQRLATNYSEEQEQYLAWIGDLRLVALLLVGVGLLLASARTGRAPAAAAVVGVGLVMADITLRANNISSGPVAAGIAALGLLIGWAVAWLNSGRPTLARRQRSAYAGAAALGAFCAFAVLVRGGWAPPAIVAVPPGLAPLTAAVVGLLVAASTVCALAAREVAVSPRTFVVTTAILGVGSGTAAYAITFGPTWTFYAATLGVPLAVALAATVRRGRAARPASLWSLVRWSVLGLIALASAPILLYVCVVLPNIMVPATELDFTSGGDFLTVFPGALVVGAALAAILSPAALRRPSVRMAVRLAPAGEATLRPREEGGFSR